MRRGAKFYVAVRGMRPVYSKAASPAGQPPTRGVGFIELRTALDATASLAADRRIDPHVDHLHKIQIKTYYSNHLANLDKLRVPFQRCRINRKPIVYSDHLPHHPERENCGADRVLRVHAKRLDVRSEGRPGMAIREPVTGGHIR